MLLLFYLAVLLTKYPLLYYIINSFNSQHVELVDQEDDGPLSAGGLNGMVRTCREHLYSNINLL